MIKKKSQFNVNKTLDRLTDILKSKNIYPVARVDHAAAAKSVDMLLRPTQVLFFGNPNLGTVLMQKNQASALELPMRVLAWEDEDGETWVGYHSPQSIVDSLELEDVSETALSMEKALDNLTNLAINR